jgi:predicted TIM-barrel fold metal-dependent hydrolase
VADRDYFIVASECHLIGDLSQIFYYPEVLALIESAAAGTGRVWETPPPPEDGTAGLMRLLDEAGVDVAFGLRESFMDTTGFAACWSTNGYVMQEIAQYPDRLYLECNVGPVIRRGARHAVWELEYLVKNHNAKLCKVYQPEDEGPLNDPRMWPFYEKAQELGIPLTVHLGMAYVRPQYTKNCLPIQLDDVLTDFPDLKVIGYHMGWPYHEELFGLAGKHKNLYIGISGIVGWFARAPYKGYHLIGEALEWAGPDKIVFGLDWPGVNIKKCVDYIRNLEMPVELQERWGYPAITDETRAKILGLTLARLTNIEPDKRV